MAVAEEKDRLVPAEAEAKWRARQAERGLEEAQAAAAAAQKVRSRCRRSRGVLGCEPATAANKNGGKLWLLNHKP